MGLTTRVPLNTMLADLDESVRSMLTGELARHGFDGVEVAFEAPTKEWAASVSAPTVSLFMYDVRERKDERMVEWELDDGGHAHRPPLRIDASYAVTAWTREVQDEHRLLSQILAILYAYPTLPAEALRGTLANGAHPYPLRARVAQPRQDGGADFWSAVGGQYKASVDYAVTVAFDSGTSQAPAPEVRTQTVRAYHLDRPRAIVQESHRVGGTVCDGDGEPVADAWVVLVETERWTIGGEDGRFRFADVAPGRYRCVARTPGGAEGEAEITVPGRGADIVVGEARSRRAVRTSPGTST